MTGNPVECVVHPDLWNKTKLWDPLAIGRVRIETWKENEENVDDEYVEENYGSPINSVRKNTQIRYYQYLGVYTYCNIRR